MRVLVVEDEEIMADALARGLRRSGYAVDVVVDGAAALEQAGVNHYDVVLLDRDLPLVHGDEVCRTLVREHSAARILMLTAAGSVAEKVDGFALGADDYLPKPFAFAELLARVEALAHQRPAHLVAVDDRQVAVEQDHVVVVDRGLVQGCRSVGDEVDGVARATQPEDERVAHDLLVLDDQHPHGRTLARERFSPDKEIRRRC